MCRLLIKYEDNHKTIEITQVQITFTEPLYTTTRIRSRSKVFVGKSFNSLHT